MSSYTLFATALGTCAIAWSSLGITRLQLPEADDEAIERMILARAGGSRVKRPPAFVSAAIDAIRAYLECGKGDLSWVPLDMTGTPGFHQKVYVAARAVGAGQTATYGELASAAGSPGAARAAGQAMAKNPVPLLVPCHRIVAAGGALGGFSAFGGLETKRRLLTLEGAAPPPGKKPRRPAAELGKKPGSVAIIDANAALAHLRRADGALARVIDAVGAMRLYPQHRQSPYEALAEAVVYQQLTGKAAATIFGRVKALFSGDAFPGPEALLEMPDDALRSAGLSRAKAASLKDLAAKTLEGVVPTHRAIVRMTDEEIVERLTRIRGIGRWTVEMLLIFKLGRPDVLPAGDYGVRKGFARAYGLPELPTPAEVLARGERWRPFRTAAAWYLWRALELPREALQSPAR